MELLITIGIISVVALAIYQFQLDIVNFGRTLTSQLITQNDARKAAESMISELRLAAPSDLGTYPIESVSTSSVVFYANVDQDASRERIRYFLSGKNLQRGIIQATGSPATYPAGNEVVTTLAQFLVNGTTSIFSYYDANYTGSSAPLPSPVDIPSIRHIKIYVAIDETGRAPLPITVTSSVSLRNLKDNY